MGVHSDRDFQAPGGAGSGPNSWPGPEARLPGGRFHRATRVLLCPLWGRREAPGPSAGWVTWSLCAPSPLFPGSPPFLVMAGIVPHVSPSPLRPWPPCQGLVPFPGTKGCPRSALPGEGGGWVWPLEPLSPHGAAGAPPPPGTQMRFIQQTKPPPPPATQARGPGPHRGKGVVTGPPDKFSLPRFPSSSPTIRW